MYKNIRSDYMYSDEKNVGQENKSDTYDESHALMDIKKTLEDIRETERDFYVETTTMEEAKTIAYNTDQYNTLAFVLGSNFIEVHFCLSPFLLRSIFIKVQFY